MSDGRVGKGRADRGYILVFVLGVLMTIGVLLADVSRRSHLGGSILLNSAERVERRLITSGGIEIGIAVLADRLGGAPDRVSIPSFEVQLGDRLLAIEIEDECGKLNLKTADAETMKRFFGEVGFDSRSAEKMSLSIRDNRGDPAAKENSRPGSLEELLSLDPFDASMMGDLAHFVTVSCPRRSISAWTASREVLVSLRGSDRRSIDQFVDDRSSDSAIEPARQLNARNLSKEPGWLSATVGPIYTIRSSIMNNGKRAFTQEQLVYIGGNDIGKRMVLRTTFPRSQESLE